MLKKSNPNSILYYIHNFKYSSIFIRNLVIILLIIILPIGGLNYFVFKFTNNNTEKEINSLNIQSLNKTKDVLDTIFSEIERLSVQIGLDELTLSFLLGYGTESATIDSNKTILRNINMFSYIYEYIDSIYIYSDNNKQIITNKWSGKFEKFPDNSWYDGYINIKEKELNRIFLTRKLKTENNEYPYLITLVKPVKFYVNQSIGAIVVNIDIVKLSSVIGNIDKADFQNLFITDSKGTIFYSKDLTLISKNINDQSFIDQRILESSEFSKIINIGNTRKTLSVLDSQNKGFKYISLVPLEFYSEKNKEVVRFIWSFIGISILLSMAISFLISIRTYAPIRNIISVINNQNGSSRPKITIDNNRFNETAYITNSILKSFDSNKKMEEELANSLIRLDKAQTLALQSQINPHFLHNTLETIRIMVIKATGNIQSPAASMLVSLSEMLRISMETKEYLIDISSEIAHCKRYIDILRIRYTDRFTVLWQIPEEIFVYKIVKLSLQPLIENAFYHGIKPEKKHGTIVIKGYVIESDIHLEIIDDGVGMPNEVVEFLNRQFQDKYSMNEEHVGMANVNQRLKLIFGDKYGIKVHSVEGLQTIIHVNIPIIRS